MSKKAIKIIDKVNLNGDKDLQYYRNKMEFNKMSPQTTINNNNITININKKSKKKKNKLTGTDLVFSPASYLTLPHFFKVEN